MYGKLTMEINNNNDRLEISVHPQLCKVNDIDKVLLLNSFCQALHISTAHILTAIFAKDEIDSEKETYEVDASGLADVLKMIHREDEDEEDEDDDDEDCGD